MTDTTAPLAFAAPAPVTLPVAGDALRVPVRRVYCVGRNYAEHAREMGHDPDRAPPFFFQKNPDDLVPVPEGGADWAYPPMTADLHHEVELALVLSRGARDIDAEAALAHVWGYGVAIDFTRRDLQGEAKKAGRPWEAGKAFERSAPIGPLVPAARLGHPARGRIALTVNGAARQQGDLSELIWPVPGIIAELSRLFVLAPGDVILTGTPAGVGPVARGDTVEASVEGVGTMRLRVV